MPKIITLCTDFCSQDGYVAAMKGAILCIAPDATLVDISHDITPQGILQAAFVLHAAYPYFPPSTVHVVVVDPGVGTSRRALALRTTRGVFVAPDNGVLSAVLRDECVQACVALEDPAYWRTPTVSTTFHGRDIFAPVGAHLANGVPMTALGPCVQDPVCLAEVRPTRGPHGAVTGHVIHVDTFGNLITSIPAKWVAATPGCTPGSGRLRSGVSRAPMPMSPWASCWRSSAATATWRSPCVRAARPWPQARRWAAW